MNFRPRLHFLLIALALSCAPRADAGNVFKCKDANGGTVYQNHACDGDQETLQHRQFEPEPAAAPKPTHTYREVPASANATPSTTAQRSRYPQVSRPPSSGRASAYQCSDGSHQWISETPCPRTVTRYQTERVTTAIHNDVAIQQTITTPHTTQVQQQGLDGRQLCQQVNSGARTSSNSVAGAEDGYERNKMRDRKGC